MSLTPAAASWKRLTDLAASEPSAHRRALLRTVLTHIECEVAGHLDGTMATLTEDPDYRVWGATDHDGPRGRAAVRAMYEAQVAIGKNRLEFDVERVLADDEVVVTEGVFHHAYSGAQLVRDGHAQDADVVPEERYLLEYRALVVWVMTPDALIAGEDTYKAEPARVVRRLGAGEMPHLGLAAGDKA